MRDGVLQTDRVMAVGAELLWSSKYLMMISHSMTQVWSRETACGWTPPVTAHTCCKINATTLQGEAEPANDSPAQTHAARKLTLQLIISSQMIWSTLRVCVVKDESLLTLCLLLITPSVCLVPLSLSLTPGLIVFKRKSFQNQEGSPPPSSVATHHCNVLWVLFSWSVRWEISWRGIFSLW